MRYKDLVENEEDQDLPEQTADRLVEYCGPLFRTIDYQEEYLPWRGIGKRDTDQLVDLMNVRNDRQPRNTDLLYHEALNLYFERKGYKVNRSNSVFVSTKEVAKGYGNLYLAFPIGQFNYLWSDEWEDLIEFTDSMEYSDLLRIPWEDVEERLQGELTEENYEQLGHLHQIESGVEDNILHTLYMAPMEIDFDFDIAEDIKDDIISELNREDLIKYMNYDLFESRVGEFHYNSGFKEAIQSDHEVMIKPHSDQYYVVKESLWPEVAKILRREGWLK